MPNNGKFTIEFKMEVVDPSTKFDGPNTKMDEVDITGNNAKWLVCFPY